MKDQIRSILNDVYEGRTSPNEGTKQILKNVRAEIGNTKIKDDIVCFDSSKNLIEKGMATYGSAVYKEFEVLRKGPVSEYYTNDELEVKEDEY